MKEDIEVCFICSLEKTFFDTNSHNFENHVEFDHNIWDYIYFIYSIKKKDYTEYNGIESYVKEKIDKEDIRWLPFYRTRVLNENTEKEETQLRYESMKKIAKNIIKLKKDK